MFKCTHKITINKAFRNLFVILISISRCFIGPRNIVSYRLNDGVDIFVMLKQESTFGTAKKALVEVCVQLQVLFTILWTEVALHFGNDLLELFGKLRWLTLDRIPQRLGFQGKT